MTTPPNEVPSQASEVASDGADRAPPSSAAIGFKATAVIQSAPNDVASSATETAATIHADRVSSSCVGKLSPGGSMWREVARVTGTYTARWAGWYHGFRQWEDAK